MRAFYTYIGNVEIRDRVTRSYKDSHGDTVFVREEIGWFITLPEFGIALGLGHNAGFEPEFKPGDKVKITMEKY